MAEESPTTIIVSGTNGELLSENPTSKPEGDVKTGDEVNSNEPNGSPGETPVDPEPVSKPKLTAEEYLEKYKINILFEELIYRTLDGTPESPLKFLLSNLETMERENWEPGYSQEEKATAVNKIFKIRVPEKSDPPKSTAGARPGAGRGTTPKAGTSGTTKPVSTRVTTTRPSATSKVASSPPRPTTTRTTTTKPVVKAPAPVKTATPATTRTTTTSTTRVTSATTRTTTGGAKIGTTATSRPTTAPKATTGATKTTETPTETTATPTETTTTPTETTTAPKTTTGATKTTTGATKTTTGATKTTTTPPKTTTASTRTTTAPARTTTAPSRTTTAPKRTTTTTTATSRVTTTRTPTTPKSTTKQPSGATRTTTTPRTGSGARATGATKQPAGKGAMTTATSGKGTKTVSGAKVDKTVAEPAEPEPQPKTQTPVEEPPVSTAIPEVTEEPREKTPEDDGVCSKIPGSEEPEVKQLDLEEQLARDDAANLSDEEIVPVAEATTIDNQSNKPPIEDVSQVAEPVEKPPEKVMTSEDYAADLQTIENEAEQANQGDRLEDMIDEGIVMREDFASESDPSSRLRSADEANAPEGASNAPEGASNAPVLVPEVFTEPQEVTKEETPPDTQETTEVGFVALDESPVEKQSEPAPLIEDLIDTTEATSVPPSEPSHEQKFSEDLGIDVSDQYHILPSQDLVETGQEAAAEPVESPPTEPEKLLDTTIDLSSDGTDPLQKVTPEIVLPSEQVPDTYEPTADVSDEPTQPNPLINPVEPSTPPEEAPHISQTEPSQHEVPPVPSPEPEPEPEPIEPIFPPASTGDDNN